MSAQTQPSKKGAKFVCLTCGAYVKANRVASSIPLRSGDRLGQEERALRFHQIEGNACGPLVWVRSDAQFQLHPHRDVVLGETRRALHEAYGVDQAEILFREIEKGWRR